MAVISVEQVRSAVHKYWEVMASKKPGELAKLYSFDAFIFSPFAARPELARVSASRRDREYCANAETTFHYEITSPIEIHLLSDTVAVAVYTSKTVAKNIKEPILGKTFNRTIADGRQTHVFILDPEGKIVMVHQHSSDVCRAPVEAAH